MLRECGLRKKSRTRARATTSKAELTRCRVYSRDGIGGAHFAPAPDGPRRHHAVRPRPRSAFLLRPSLPLCSIHGGRGVSQNQPTGPMMVQPGARDTTSSQRFASRAAASVLLIGSFVMVGQVLSIG